MSPILRPHAVCDAVDPICPRCSQVLVGKAMQKPDGSIMTCMNGRAGESCGQRVALIGQGSMVTVVGLDREEFDRLLEDTRSLKDGLRDLEILVGRVA